MSSEFRIVNSNAYANIAKYLDDKDQLALEKVCRNARAGVDQCRERIFSPLEGIASPCLQGRAAILQTDGLQETDATFQRACVAENVTILKTANLSKVSGEVFLNAFIEAVENHRESVLKIFLDRGPHKLLSSILLAALEELPRNKLHEIVLVLEDSEYATDNWEFFCSYCEDIFCVFLDEKDYASAIQFLDQFGEFIDDELICRNIFTLIRISMKTEDSPGQFEQLKILTQKKFLDRLPKGEEGEDFWGEMLVQSIHLNDFVSFSHLISEVELSYETLQIARNEAMEIEYSLETPERSLSWSNPIVPGPRDAMIKLIDRAMAMIPDFEERKSEESSSSPHSLSKSI